jgi:hypothetical protein
MSNLFLQAVGCHKNQGGFFGRDTRKMLANLKITPDRNGTVFAMNRLAPEQYKGLFELLTKIHQIAKVPFALKLLDYNLIVGDEKHEIPAIDFKLLADRFAMECYDKLFDWHKYLLDFSLLPGFLNELAKKGKLPQTSS